jgi:TPR repeat protein
VWYANGKHVPKDYVQAYKWFSLASAQGDENAQTAKASLAQRMTPEQIAEGFRVARDFKPPPPLAPSASDPVR